VINSNNIDFIDSIQRILKIFPDLDKPVEDETIRILKEVFDILEKICFDYSVRLLCIPANKANYIDESVKNSVIRPFSPIAILGCKNEIDRISILSSILTHLLLVKQLDISIASFINSGDAWKEGKATLIKIEETDNNYAISIEARGFNNIELSSEKAAPILKIYIHLKRFIEESINWNEFDCRIFLVGKENIKRDDAYNNSREHQTSNIDAYLSYIYDEHIEIRELLSEIESMIIDISSLASNINHYKISIMALLYSLLSKMPFNYYFPSNFVKKANKKHPLGTWVLSANTQLPKEFETLLRICTTHVWSQITLLEQNNEIKDKIIQKYNIHQIHNVKTSLDSAYSNLEKFEGLCELSSESEAYFYFTQSKNALASVKNRAEAIMKLDKKKKGKIKRSVKVLKKQFIIDRIVDSLYSHVNINNYELINAIIQQKEYLNWIDYVDEEYMFEVEESLEVALVELVDNAIKFTDLNFGVRIKCKKEESHIQIVIINSKPMPDLQVKYINSGFSEEHLNEQTALGYGLPIISDAVDVLNAKAFVALENNHTHFSLKFPS